MGRRLHRALPAVLLSACSADFRSGAEIELAFTEPPVAAPPPKLQLSEVQSDNASTVMHDGFAFPDWVELTNADVAAVPLSRITLAGSGAEVWRGPSVGDLAPGEQLVLWADGDPAAGDTLPFALDAGGDGLTLAVDGVPVDAVNLPALVADTSYARFPEGAPWAVTGRPTPGATNGALPADPDPSAALYTDTRILDVWLTLDAAGVASLNADPYTEVPGTFAFEGAFFPEVSIRLKGVYGSLRTLDQKCSFRVDVNDYADHAVRGQHVLAFNNLVQDPSYLHEYLTYALFRAMGVPAPRVGYARVTLNGTYYGLYTLIEYPDDPFLARWYADPSGNLYEGEYGVDFVAEDLWEFDQDEGADDNDRSDLAELIAALDQPADDAGIAHLASLVDLDEFAAEMAVEAVSYHWDGYTTANNYRVYHDPSTGLFTMLPWGADQTWHEAWYEPYAGGGRLFQYCLSNASCRALYSEKLRLAADTLEALDLATELDHLAGFLAADITADPRREFDVGTASTWTTDTRTNLVAAPARVRAAAEPTY